jgi:hypothetical protein
MQIGRTWIACGFVSAYLAGSTLAQGLVTQPKPEQELYVWLHVQRTSFAQSQWFRFMSGSIEFGAYVPVTQRLALYAYIPVGIYEYNKRYVNSLKETLSFDGSLGNIGLGAVRTLVSGRRTIVAASGLLSLNTMHSTDIDPETYSVKKTTWYVGWWADPYRGHRFAMNWWMMAGNFQVSHELSRAVLLGAELGPQLWMRSYPAGRNELYSQGGVYANVGNDYLRFIAEYDGMLWLSGGGGQKQETYQDMAGAGVEVGLPSGVKITAYYQTMLDASLHETADGIAGINLAVPLRRH